jgi:hypothetical protein
MGANAGMNQVNFVSKSGMIRVHEAQGTLTYDRYASKMCRIE